MRQKSLEIFFDNPPHAPFVDSKLLGHLSHGSFRVAPQLAPDLVHIRGSPGSRWPSTSWAIIPSPNFLPALESGVDGALWSASELRDLLRLPPVLMADDCCDPLLLVSQLLLHLVTRWILEKFVNVDELLKNDNVALGVFEFLNVKPYKRFKNDKNAKRPFSLFQRENSMDFCRTL